MNIIWKIAWIKASKKGEISIMQLTEQIELKSSPELSSLCQERVGLVLVPLSVCFKPNCIQKLTILS
jgi:hypothetical protein